MSGGGASLSFRSVIAFWMISVTIVTEVPTIQIQMNMIERAAFHDGVPDGRLVVFLAARRRRLLREARGVENAERDEEQEQWKVTAEIAADHREVGKVGWVKSG